MATKNNSLTSEEVCFIINTCKDSQVKELKFQDLHIIMAPEPGCKEQIVPSTSKAEILEEQQKIAMDSLRDEEARAKKHQIEMMLIEDPAQAEQMIANGELEDDGEPEEI